MGYLPKAIANAKAIAFAKWSVWVKNLKMPTPCEKPFYTNIRVVLCKKPLEKTPNIREMRRFLKSAHLAKARVHAKGLPLAKWSLWVKN